MLAIGYPASRVFTIMRRLPVYILLDTAGSMRSEPIHAVTMGLRSMLSALRRPGAEPRLFIERAALMRRHWVNFVRTP